MKTNLLIFLMLFGYGCSQAQKKENAQPATSSLDPKSFKEKLAQEPTAILLDVRTPEEAAGGIIPGAIVMDFNAPDFKAKVSKLDKDKTYFVYCKVGGRSGQATELMGNKGFKKVFNLKGGYMAWVENGFETKKP